MWKWCVLYMSVLVGVTHAQNAVAVASATAGGAMSSAVAQLPHLPFNPLNMAQGAVHKWHNMPSAFGVYRGYNQNHYQGNYRDDQQHQPPTNPVYLPPNQYYERYNYGYGYGHNYGSRYPNYIPFSHYNPYPHYHRRHQDLFPHPMPPSDNNNGLSKCEEIIYPDSPRYVHPKGTTHEDQHSADGIDPRRRR